MCAVGVSPPRNIPGVVMVLLACEVRTTSVSFLVDFQEKVLLTGGGDANGGV